MGEDMGGDLIIKIIIFLLGIIQGVILTKDYYKRLR